MQIHEDDRTHLSDFVRLNETWIVARFGSEDAERARAADPAAILRTGGHIFTAMVDGEVVGAVALIRHDRGDLELARMAVAPAHQRRGIGRALALRAIGKARALGASKLSLLSNAQLGPALALYRALGFTTVDDADYPRSSRCDVVMEMRLTPP